MKMKFYPCKELTNFIISVPENNNFVPGFIEQSFTPAVVEDLYKRMKINAQAYNESMFKQMGAIFKNIQVLHYVVRLRQVIYIQMEFPVREGVVLDTEGGVQELHRRINGVFN